MSLQENTPKRSYMSHSPSPIVRFPGKSFIGIKLSHGKMALVDRTDEQLVCGLRFYANLTHGHRWLIRCKLGQIHHVIMGEKYGDHRNGNPLDNRRSNLRPATASQNNMNRRKRRDTASPFKGVWFDRRKGGWYGCINVNGKKLYSNVCRSAEEAAYAYDKLAVQYFGEFARTNFRIK